MAMSAFLAMGCSDKLTGTDEAGGVPVTFSTGMTRAAVDADKKGMQDFLVMGRFRRQQQPVDVHSRDPGRVL